MPFSFSRSFFICMFSLCASPSFAEMLNVPLISMQSNYGLDVAYASKSNGARIIQFPYRNQGNQRFDIVAGPVVKGTIYYYIKPKHTKGTMCLDVAGASQKNGAPIISFACRQTSNQQFSFTYWPGTSPENAFFKNRLSQKCLDIRDANMNQGAELIQWDCHYGANQRFRFAL